MTTPHPDSRGGDPATPQSEVIGPSTTWDWEWRKIKRRPSPQEHRVPQGRRLRLLPRRNPKVPLQMTMKWNGGADDWIEIQTRGCIVRVKGHTPAFDLVMILNRVCD